MDARFRLIYLIPWMILSVLAVETFVWLPLYLIGLMVVPFAKVQDNHFTNPIIDALWGNFEDGVTCIGFSKMEWYLRNPVTNLRRWPIISTRPCLGTQYIGSDQIERGCRFVAWHKGYVGCRWEGKKYGLWLGYKINPRDSRIIPADDYRTRGLGIACQFIRFK